MTATELKTSPEKRLSEPNNNEYSRTLCVFLNFAAVRDRLQVSNVSWLISKFYEQTRIYAVYYIEGSFFFTDLAHMHNFRGSNEIAQGELSSIRTQTRTFRDSRPCIKRPLSCLNFDVAANDLNSPSSVL